MELPICAENVHDFAYTNEELLAGNKPIGIALSFHGLNGVAMFKEHPALAMKCAQRRILFVAPYDNPWSWMNDVAVRTVDAIVTALQKRLGIKDVPVVSTGGSMGGLSALIYSRYSTHRIAACAANCPVCDLPYHFTERPDLPRTIVSALAHYDMPLPAAMESISPLHQVKALPDIPYLILHCEKDEAVNQARHSERLVAAMRAEHKRIRYVSVPDRGHGDLSPQAWDIFEQFIFDACGAERV